MVIGNGCAIRPAIRLKIVLHFNVPSMTESCSNSQKAQYLLLLDWHKTGSVLNVRKVWHRYYVWKTKTLEIIGYTPSFPDLTENKHK